MALTTHDLDVGAMTPFLWGFEEREKNYFKKIKKDKSCTKKLKIEKKY